MDDASRSVLDHFGKTFEALGSTYNLGRCYGLGMMSGEPLTQAEFADKLQISQSVVSTTVRHMIQMGVIEKVRVPGERSAHYQVPREAAKLLVESPAKRIAVFQSMLSSLLDLDLDPVARERAEMFSEIYDFFGEHLKMMLAQWEEEHRTS